MLMKKRRFEVLSAAICLLSLYFPSLSAAQESPIFIEDQGACVNSLENVWKEFGTPYPCFVDGSKIAIRVPASSTTKEKRNLQFFLGGKPTPVSASETTVNVTNYKLGLNEIYFGNRGANGELNQVGDVFQFIIYTAPIQTARLQQDRISYTLILDPLVDASKILTPEMNAKAIDIVVEGTNQGEALKAAGQRENLEGLLFQFVAHACSTCTCRNQDTKARTEQYQHYS